MASPRRLDDLILRLANPAAVDPRISRIASRIDAAYEAGDWDKAGRWDERFERWLDNREHAAAGVQDDWAESSGGHLIDDEGTGVAPWMAARFAEHKQGLFQSPEDLVANLRSVAELGTGRFPTPLQPAGDDIYTLAKQLFEDRQALRARYKDAKNPGLQVVAVDELIRRLGGGAGQ